VDKRLSVGSELRFAIDKAFREEGIEIPFAQHDIHLRDIERLEQALAALKPDRRTVPEDAAPPPGPAGEKPA
jgi:small-conductance mechanosensitive channel